MTESTTDLRVAVLGVGLMGADHLRRLAHVIAGARPVVVADAFVDKAHEVAAGFGGVRVVEDPFAAITDPEVDAVVIATPGFTHEKLVLACLDAGKPVLCEKPLTTEVDTSLAIVRAEQAVVAAGGRQLVQVGFMRRFDAEYAALKALLDSGDLGEPLMVHCAHRNASVAGNFDSAMVIKDSLVHEIDVTRFLLGEEVAAITMKYPRATSAAPAGLSDPALALLETTSGRLVDVELFVATGIGYEVRTEVVAERGTALIGLDRGPLVVSGTPARGRRVPPDFRERFAAAYDTEVARWVDAAKRGTIDGPGAWDGYAATAVVEAGLEALRTGARVSVELAPRQAVSA